MPSQLPPCRATALFIALTRQKKRQQIFLSLSLPSLLRLSPRSHCILWSVLLFKCSYSPFRRRVTFKPTVTMATPICIWKSAFEGGRWNVQQHASLSEYSKHGHVRDVMWVVSGGGGGGGEVLFVLFMRARFSLNLKFTTAVLVIQWTPFIRTISRTVAGVK